MIEKALNSNLYKKVKVLAFEVAYDVARTALFGAIVTVGLVMIPGVCNAAISVLTAHPILAAKSLSNYFVKGLTQGVLIGVSAGMLLALVNQISRVVRGKQLLTLETMKAKLHLSWLPV